MTPTIPKVIKPIKKERIHANKDKSTSGSPMTKGSIICPSPSGLLIHLRPTSASKSASTSILPAIASTTVTSPSRSIAPLLRLGVRLLSFTVFPSTLSSRVVGKLPNSSVMASLIAAMTFAPLIAVAKSRSLGTKKLSALALPLPRLFSAMAKP